MADIVLILILALFAYRGGKKGFVKTLLGIVSTLISLIFSMILYNPISKFLYMSSFGNGVKDYVYEFLVKNTESTSQLLENDVAVESASMLVMNVISFIIVIILAKIFTIILANILNITAKFPIIKQANKLLGMIAGFFSGLLICYIACGVLKTFSADFIKESILNSLVAIKLYENNIVFSMLSNFVK
ncbi:MAG: CvpA family protein [Clostridia bacterium]|nr:CvpA family protein [Clostridia bacterium]